MSQICSFFLKFLRAFRLKLIYSDLKLKFVVKFNQINKYLKIIQSNIKRLFVFKLKKKEA